MKVVVFFALFLLSSGLAVEIHGHRGSRGTHPENTLPAFAEAVSANAFAIEIDLQLTREGIPVVAHDPEINGNRCRVPSGETSFKPIPLLQLTVADLIKFDCGSVPDANFPKQKLMPGARIPTFEAVLAWVRQNHVRQRLTVELKTTSSPPPSPSKFVRSVFGLASQYDLKPQIILQSYSADILRAAEAIDPSVPRAYLTHGKSDFCVQAATNRFSFAFPDAKSVSKDSLSACLKHGVPVIPYTVNDPDGWKRLIELGVRGIITDYPRALGEFLKTLAQGTG